MTENTTIKINNETTIKTLISNLIDKAKNNNNTLLYSEIKQLFNSINEINVGALPDKVQDNLMDVIRSLGISIIIETAIEAVETAEYNAEEIDDMLVPENKYDIDEDLDYETDEDLDYETEYVDSYTSDVLSTYLKTIGKVPLLKPEEELELTRQYKETGDAEIKKKICEHNLKLVVSIAKKYAMTGVDLLELIQEGNIGLMTAIDKFDYTLGYRLTTFATWWIRQAVQRYIMNNSKAIRIPVHAQEAVYKVTKATRKLVQELGREPSLEELSAETGFDVQKLAELQAIPTDITSLDAPVKNGEGDGDESTLGEFLADDNYDNCVEDIVQDKERRKAVEQLIGTLKDREQFVIRRRFGFDGSPCTLETVGEELGVTRERVRQIEAKALKKLKLYPKRKIVEEYIPK